MCIRDRLVVRVRGIVLERHRKATVLPQRDGVGALQFGAGADNRLACRFLFGIVCPHDFHAGEPLCRFGMGLRRRHILFIARNGFGEFSYFSRVLPQHQIFQSEPLIQVIGFQHIQLADLHIQIALFDNQRVAGGKRCV